MGVEVAAGNRRCQPPLNHFVTSWEKTRAEEGPYDDSLNWVKFEDKELLISNKVEYLSV
jgi:hypothetical protein